MRHFILAVGLVFSSCSSPTSTTPPSETTIAPVAEKPLSPAQVFTDYLHNSFGHTIPPVGEHWYVVIPAVGCQGCAHTELRNLASTVWGPSVSVVSSGLLRDLTAVERKNLAQRVHLLADTLRVAGNTLDRINLPFTTLTGIVHTRNGHVVEFLPFDNDSYHQVFAALPKRQWMKNFK